MTPPSAGGTWTETVLYSFQASSDGVNPQWGVVIGGNGSLYGVTSNGGTIGCGAVFELLPPSAPGGAWSESLLHSFTCGSQGSHPYAGLVLSGDGTLIGTTTQGGSSNKGVIFQLTPGIGPSSVAANLPTNPAARVETSDGKDELVLTGLDKLEDPPSLIRLREAVNARLPRVDLPKILLEIAARTEFTAKFTHVSERESRVGDLATSLCAVLIAEGCNIGLEPLVRNDVPALRRSRENSSWEPAARRRRGHLQATSLRCRGLRGRRAPRGARRLKPVQAGHPLNVDA